MSAPIDWTKPIETEGGAPARLLASDLQSRWGRAVAVKSDDGMEIICQSDDAGYAPSGALLRNVQPQPRKFGFVRWVSILADGTVLKPGCLLDCCTAQEAERDYPESVARVKVVIEGVEGQFDE